MYEKNKYSNLRKAKGLILQEREIFESDIFFF